MCVPMCDISILLLCHHTNPALRTPNQSAINNPQTTNIYMTKVEIGLLQISYYEMHLVAD